MDTTPQVQKYKQTVLDPDTLSQVLGGSSSQAVDPVSAAVTQAQTQAQVQNVLQQYKNMQQGGFSGQSQNPYGPPPQGMSQSEWNGLCEAYAEKQVYGHTGVYPSALSAAQDFAKQGRLNPDITKAPKGALIYFNDPNQPNGHVGIADGKGNFNSATYNGVQNNSLKSWIQSTGQQPLGFVVPK